MISRTYYEGERKLHWQSGEENMPQLLMVKERALLSPSLQAGGAVCAGASGVTTAFHNL